MKKFLSNLRHLSYLILTATIIFNLYLNYPETKILADPNDNIFQYSLVARTNWVWDNYDCPLSLSCLPNLLDHNVPTWAEGYPLPFYYSHIPQIAIVSSYNLLIKPIVSLFSLPFTLYAYYNLTKYLLFCLFPLSVFLALKITGFSPLLSSLGAVFAAHFSTDGLYGIDPPSFLWRGYGLTSQLYAMFFLPLGIAYTYKALRHLRGGRMDSSKVEELVSDWTHKSKSKNPKSEYRNSKQICPPAGGQMFQTVWNLGFGKLGSVSNLGFRASNLFLAAVFLTLTAAGHLGLGIIGLLSTLPFLFLDFKTRNIFKRVKKAFLIYAFVFIALSYWLIPILLNNNYHIVSFWDPIWKFNSYGWYEVIRQFLSGEIFDANRAPIITGLIITGFFAVILNNRLFPFAVLFAMWMLLYFGRTTWNGLIDLIPGMKDFHQHRFIVGVHIAALFLIPAGIEVIFQLLKKLSKLFTYISAFGDFHKFLLPSGEGEETDVMSEVSFRSPEVRETRKPAFGLPFLSTHFFGHAKKWVIYTNIIFYILSISFILTFIYFSAKQTVSYASLNNRWIGEANRAYLQDEKNFQDLTAYLNTLPNARIYAGRPGNWGKSFRLGSSQMYMLFGIKGFDVSQFLPETWSMLSENEQNFDERVALDYDLLNIRYIAADKNHDFTKKKEMVKKFGPFELYEVPTTGWFDVVTSPMFVKTDKTDFINLVHYWHRTYPRRWKMHPLISVEKKPKIPPGMQKVIEMKDEVSYIESDKTTPGVARIRQLADPEVKEPENLKNIFSDFPFVFPESTPSGKIIAEKVNRQTYTATVEISDKCQNCFIMFKMSYHPNWQLKVDGHPQDKFAVFPFYLAAQIPSGSHTVEFSYRPNKLKVVLLAGEAITGLLIFIFLFRKSAKITPV